MLCYNTGVELYQRKLYSQSIIWLKESYALGKGSQTIGPQNQVLFCSSILYLYIKTECVWTI